MDVLPQLIERIEAIEKHLSVKPVNGLTVESLTGTTVVTDELTPGTPYTPAVQPGTPEPGLPSSDAVTLDTGTSTGKSKKS